MKKILLVTLQGANYGNRLQNYALQTSLEMLDCEVWTPYYDIPERDNFYKKVKYYTKALLFKLGVKRFVHEYTHLLKERTFRYFNEKYITNLFKLSYEGAFKRNWESYDFAITGSDQVWHRWSDSPKELEYFYLQFVPERKRISYAASFGFSQLPESDLDIHKRGLKGIPSISCRETEALSLITNVTGNSPTLVCDPTLLLSSSQWLKIAKKPTYYNGKKYVLLYFLGKLNDEYLHAIDIFIRQHKYQRIELINLEHLDWYVTRPDEFLWLVQNAEWIFTDSYHATIFSLIFSKRITIYKRIGKGYDQMFGRLETLINKYNLEECVFNGEINDNNLDYDDIHKLIQKEADSSLLFLKHCLSQNNSKG